MDIAVDTRLLLFGKLDGIGWFTRECFLRITRRHPEHTFHFLFDRPYHPEFVFGENVVPHVLYPQARHPILFKIWYDFSVPRFLKKINPALLVCPGPIASLRTRVPQLVVLHDLNFEHYPNDLRASHSRYLRKYSVQWARQAQRIATVSEFSKSDIVSTYNIQPEKIDVVYNGAGEHFRVLDEATKAATRSQFADGHPYFVFISSILPRKNLRRLLLAYDQFRQKTGLSHKLVVVGHNYQMDEETRSVLVQMNFRNDVVFAGRLDADVLARVLGAATALTYVSYFEGFGIPLLEAFHCGVPVITSTVTSMPEVAGDAALLVDPMSVEDITDAMVKVATDEGLCRALAKRGLERASDFSWDSTSEKLWESMQRAIADAG